MSSDHFEESVPPEAQTSTHKRSYKLVIAAAVGITILLILVPIYTRFAHSATVQAVASAPPTVIVSRPVQKQVAGRMQLLGQFSAVDEVDLRAEVGGTLTYIGFTDGQIVEKGKLLFIIDPTPYQIKVDQGAATVTNAQARLSLANDELRRAQTLESTGAGTTENAQQRAADQKYAQAAFTQAQATQRDAEFDLAHTRVYAPFTGKIGAHQISVGNLVAGSRTGGSSSTLLASLMTVDPVYLNFDMSEGDYLTYQRERAARTALPSSAVTVAIGDETAFGRTGHLTFLDNGLDRSSGTLHARATLSNADRLLTPGEFGRVRIQLPTAQNVLLVPDSAVMADQADHMILVVDASGTAVGRKVTTGDLRFGLRVITSGLSPSDEVIIGGPPIAAGTRVTPTNGTIMLDSDEKGA